MKVHLVDGTFELFRCFFGAPQVTNAAGEEVGACRALLNTLVSLLRQPDVTHVAIAFDQVVDVTRRGKTLPITGPGTDPKLRSQFPLAADLVRALGLVMWPMIRYQADDALATGAARYKNAPGVEQVVLCTPDNDLAQCVEGTRVVMLDRIRKRITDERGVIEKFGVPPSAIPTYLALVGDPSDGLPGVPGWGARSTATVLARYKTLEAIPDDASAWDVQVRGAARLAASLSAHRREAYLYRNLSVLWSDLPIVEEVGDLEWCGADRAALQAIAARIEETDTLARIPLWRASA